MHDYITGLRITVVVMRMGIVGGEGGSSGVCELEHWLGDIPSNSDRTLIGA